MLRVADSYAENATKGFMDKRTTRHYDGFYFNGQGRVSKQDPLHNYFRNEISIV